MDIFLEFSVIFQRLHKECWFDNKLKLFWMLERPSSMVISRFFSTRISTRNFQVEKSGAVAIVTQAMVRLTENGVTLTEKDQTRLVSNLLAVVCSDTKVVPTISLSEHSD